MNAYYALMAIFGQLACVYLLSYPVEWIIDQTYGRACDWILAQQSRWMDL